MKDLKNLKESGQVLNKEEMKEVRGGVAAVAYCTNGPNAKCYEHLDDAARACGLDPLCDTITEVNF